MVQRATETLQTELISSNRQRRQADRTADGSGRCTPVGGAQWVEGQHLSQFEALARVQEKQPKICSETSHFGRCWRALAATLRFDWTAATTRPAG